MANKMNFKQELTGCIGMPSKRDAWMDAGYGMGLFGLKDTVDGVSTIYTSDLYS
jgi:hypothetical protein